jgi:hypothetical protein
VRQRWDEGVQNSQPSWRESKAQGYPHSDRALRAHLEALRGNKKTDLPAACVLDQFSAKTAVWLFMRPVEQLKESARAALLTLLQTSSLAAPMSQLVQEFLPSVQQLEGELRDAWIAQVIASQIKELQRFAKGLERDTAAVLAGLTLSHTKGQAEGQVTRIKLSKRMLYGRAGFALFRQRVLPARSAQTELHEQEPRSSSSAVPAQATDARMEQWGEVIPLALLDVRSLPIMACAHLSAHRRPAATWLAGPGGTRGVPGISLRQLFTCRNVSTSTNGDFVAHPHIGVAGMIHSSSCCGNINQVQLFPNLHRIVARNRRDIGAKLLLSHDRSADPAHACSLMDRLASKHPHPLNRGGSNRDMRIVPGRSERGV